MTPADIFMISELPYPLFNDILLKQIEENKKQQKSLQDISKQKSSVRKKR